jgi:predicted transcriptional regulator
MINYAKTKDEEYLGESIEEYNLALEKADAEIDAGHFIVHEEAMKKLGEWRNKEK